MAAFQSDVRKTILIACVVMLSAGSFYACRQHGRVSQEEIFLKKLHAIETSIPPLWPGFSSAKAPLILRFGSEGALLVGLPPKDACGFQPVKKYFADISVIPALSYFRPGDYLPWLQQFDVETLKSCAGETYFSNYNLMQGILCRDVLFHEYFHSYQKRNFKFASVKKQIRPGLTSVQAVAAYIEQILLSKALTASGPEWKDYARKFCALRLFRKQLPDPYSFNALEDSLETLEGTAVYFELRTREFDFGTSAARLSAGEKRWPLQADLHIAGELLMSEFTSDRLLYWRQYNTGAAQGLLLDRAGADWKSAVQDGRPLFSVFSAVFSVPVKDIPGIVKTVKSEYGYPALLLAAGRVIFPEGGPFVDSDYHGRIIIRTCGSSSIITNASRVATVSERFSDGSSGRLYENLAVEKRDSFRFESENPVVFNEKLTPSSGKECRNLEISLLFPLSRLSIDRTGCVPDFNWEVCKGLTFYGVKSEGHFSETVKLSRQGKTLFLDVQP